MPKRLKRAADNPAVAARFSQPTLAGLLRLPEPPPPRVSLPSASTNGDVDNTQSEQLLVVDLFCGIGGWSEGSRQAGHRVVLAVDYEESLLRIHAKNHKHCKHLRIELGPNNEDYLVAQIRNCVPEGRKWHLHASPPCTAISRLRSCSHSRDVYEGMRLVLWYLSLVLRLKPTTWSMEEVGTPVLDGVLTAMQHLHPDVFDFVSDVPFDLYGVPQTRKRTLAGTPALIHRLETDVSLKEDAPVLSDVLDPPEGATLVKSAAGRCVNPDLTVTNEDGSVTNSTHAKCMKSVHEVCYTCTASNTHYWVADDFSTIRSFNVREQAALQCFPPTYQFGPICVSVLGIGNAVPCLIARKFMEGCV